MALITSDGYVYLFIILANFRLYTSSTDCICKKTIFISRLVSVTKYMRTILCCVDFKENKKKKLRNIRQCAGDEPNFCSCLLNRGAGIISRIVFKFWPIFFLQFRSTAAAQLGWEISPGSESLPFYFPVDDHVLC